VDCAIRPALISGRLFHISTTGLKGDQIVVKIQQGGLDKNARFSLNTGFSLLEVLIAATIFSFGLAGFAALLLASIAGSTQAHREGTASMAAASLSEQIRLNPVSLDRFINPPDQISRICAGNNQCTPWQQADYDFRLWQLELADRIQNAKGLVCRDGTPEDGAEGDSHCDDTGPLVIKIFWDGGRTDKNGRSEQHRFVLEVS
jgi:type IV pilus modification protein PilV